MRRSTTLLIVLASLLVVVVWFLLFINPKRTELSDLQDQIDVVQVQAQGLRGEKAALLAIRDSELTYRRASAELERSIPTEPELAQFIEDTNLLAQETGVLLNTLNPSPPQAVEGQLFQTLSVSMAVEGQFFELLGFLFGLEDMERLVKVSSLNLAASVDGDGNLVLNGSITAQIFTLAIELPTPMAPVPAPDEGEASPEEQPEPPPPDEEEQSLETAGDGAPVEEAAALVDAGEGDEA